MNEKSFVSLERHVCLVCGAAFDTGSLLLDKRGRKTLEHYTTTGWGLCDEHRKLFESGYVALVECDPQRSGLTANATCMKPEDAYRTGRLAHVKREVFKQLFNMPIATEQPCVFIEPGVIEKLEALTPRAD